MIDEFNEYRRKNDVLLAELNQKFKDFIERYERDWEETHEWRRSQFDLLQTHDEFIREFKPTYLKATVVVTAVILGSVGLAVKWFWDRVKWG